MHDKRPGRWNREGVVKEEVEDPMRDVHVKKAWSKLSHVAWEVMAVFGWSKSTVCTVGKGRDLEMFQKRCEPRPIFVVT
jgi:hypothetical protein